MNENEQTKVQSPHVTTEGGTYIDGDVNIGRGWFIGRNLIISIFGPDALNDLQQSLQSFVTRHRWWLIAAALAELLLRLLFTHYQARYLLSPLAYGIAALLLLTMIDGWRRVIRRGSLLLLDNLTTTLVATGLTLAFMTVIGYQARAIVYPEQMPTKKFGIAVALFGKGADFRITDLGRDIQTRLYNNLNIAISEAKDLSETVELRSIGVIRSTTEGAVEGGRIGADLVLWGQILESDSGIEVHFQALETALFVDDPIFPRAMPLLAPSLHICVGLEKANNSLIQVARSQIIGLSTFSLGLYYYLNQFDAKSAEKEFENALRSFQNRNVSTNDLLCGNDRANLGLVLYYLGKSYQLQGRYEESQQILNQAAVLNPDDSAILLGQAYNYRAMGQLVEAQTTIKRILDQSYISEPASLYNQALAYETIGYYEDARRKYESILSREPNFFVANLNLARVLYKLQLFAEAEAQYEKTATLTDGDITREAWFHLEQGQFYEEIGQLEPAIQAYGRASAILSKLVTPYLYRAQIYEQQKIYDHALEDYKTVIKHIEATSANPGWAYATFAAFLLRIKHYEQAIEQYQQALDSPNPDPLIHAYLGQVYAERGEVGDREQALEQFELALQNPSVAEPYIYDLYGHALYRFGDINGAILQLEKSSEGNPNIDSKVVTDLNLGQLQVAMGNIEDARMIYTSILALQDQISKDWSQLAQNRLSELNQLRSPSVSPSLLPIPTSQE